MEDKNIDKEIYILYNTLFFEYALKGETMKVMCYTVLGAIVLTVVMGGFIALSMGAGYLAFELVPSLKEENTSRESTLWVQFILGFVFLIFTFFFFCVSYVVGRSLGSDTKESVSNDDSLHKP